MIKVFTAARIVILKTGMKRIAKTINNNINNNIIHYCNKTL